MAERRFGNKSDARAYAKATAVSTKTVTEIYYSDDFWVVRGKAVSESETEVVSVTTDVSENDFSAAISRISENLKTTESVVELINLLKINYKKISATSPIWFSKLSDADKELCKSIPNILTRLYKASDAIADLPYVKSKEHATEMAYAFDNLATYFSGYGVAQCLRRHKQAMVEASEKLPSEVAAKTNATLSQKISRLESSIGRCKCGSGRLVIKQGKNGYFWGCSTFPTCFFKRALSKAEMEFLGI